MRVPRTSIAVRLRSTTRSLRPRRRRVAVRPERAGMGTAVRRRRRRCRRAASCDASPARRRMARRKGASPSRPARRDSRNALSSCGTAAGAAAEHAIRVAVGIEPHYGCPPPDGCAARIARQLPAHPRGRRRTRRRHARQADRAGPERPACDGSSRGSGRRRASTPASPRADRSRRLSSTARTSPRCTGRFMDALRQRFPRVARARGGGAERWMSLCTVS